MKCVTISGGAGHGKDTLARNIKRILESKDQKVFIIHYADYIKMVAKQVYNWNGIKNEYGRTLLQSLGDKMREINEMFIIDELLKILNLVKDDFDVVIIPDARLPKEIDILNTIGETISIHIHRVDYKSKLTKTQSNHKTETALSSYPYNYNLKIYTDQKIKELDNIIQDILK